uniref:steroid 11beta-monooxygenase n=1 Tax=Echeneis naucrates TaxID=173247 RepID=A0A665V463_ECHNA
MSVRASGSQGACRSRNPFFGVTPERALCMTAAGTVADEKLKGRKEAQGVRKRGARAWVQSFEEIPHTGKYGWVNLMKFWRQGYFRQLHKHMEGTFNALGPIYREHVGTQKTVNIILPSDIAELFQSEGRLPQRMTLKPWATHREIRQHSKGIFLKNGEEWRSDRVLLNKEVLMSSAVQRFIPLLDEVARDFCKMLQKKVEREGIGQKGKRSLTVDPSPDLFRFALEAICNVLYGERIGLFSSSPSLESQKFIWAVEQMLATTPPLLYLPHQLLLHIGASLWTQHATAWDNIFSHADARIQKCYRRLSSFQGQGSKAEAAGGQYPGVLGQLMEKGQLSLDLIKANITELMAGGVDTSVTAIMCSCVRTYLKRESIPSIQDFLLRTYEKSKVTYRKHCVCVCVCSVVFLGCFRLYPVGITVNRMPVKDIILQNYRVPAGTTVSVCLYPMGRSSDVFDDPMRFDPGRWSSGKGGQRISGFRSLAFGFGARQCVGRRIAENEMQLLLMHVSDSRHEKVETRRRMLIPIVPQLTDKGPCPPHSSS